VIVKIIIENNAIASVANELEREDIDYFRLFPDAVGLEQALSGSARALML
jgi:hypothetical protein